MFLALILRLLKLAERQPFTFGRVYGYCVASVFLFHVFINVGMVLGLTPVIGIPLPFFSYGGTALILLLGEIGVVLNLTPSYTLTDSDADKKAAGMPTCFLTAASLTRW